MIQVYTKWDYGDDDVVNKELKDLQNNGYKIIDIKFSTTSSVTENQREGGQDVDITHSVLIIYDDGIVPKESWYNRIRKSADELGIK